MRQAPVGNAIGPHLPAPLGDTFYILITAKMCSSEQGLHVADSSSPETKAADRPVSAHADIFTGGLPIF